MREGLAFRAESGQLPGRMGNLLHTIGPIAQNCAEVIVLYGKYFPEIHRPIAPSRRPRPVYDKIQLRSRRLRVVTGNAQKLVIKQVIALVVP